MKLTEKEFEMLVEALEHLPNKDMGGNLLAKLTMAAMFKSDEEGKKRAEDEFARMQEQERLLHKEVKKECFILIGKLHMMKGQLVEEQS